MITISLLMFLLIVCVVALIVIIAAGELIIYPLVDIAFIVFVILLIKKLVSKKK